MRIGKNIKKMIMHMQKTYVEADRNIVAQWNPP